MTEPEKVECPHCMGTGEDYYCEDGEREYPEDCPYCFGSGMVEEP